MFGPVRENLPWHVASAFSVPLTDSSWNPAVKCQAIVLTAEQFIGSVPNPRQHPPSQGADYSGGALKLAGNYPPGTNAPSSTWEKVAYSKRSTNPPCNVRLSNSTLAPTLVEIRGLTVTGVSLTGECGSVFPHICDETFHLCNAVLAPNCSDNYPDSMHMFHAEIDMYWVRNHIAPPAPSSGYTIDVQGFAYWDDGHLQDAWHAFSGWELHPLTAWRTSPLSSPITASFDYSPTNATVGSRVTLNAHVIGGTMPYSYGWRFGDGDISGSNATVTHIFAKPGNYNVSLTVADAKGFRITLFHIAAIENAADFNLVSDQTSVSMTPGSSMTMTVTASSTQFFSGSLNLSAYVASNGLQAQLAKNNVSLKQASSVSVLLQINVGPGVSAGSYPIVIEAVNGNSLRVATVNVNIPGFSLAVDTSFLEIPTNTIGNFSISITSLGGFSGTVNLGTAVSNASLHTVLGSTNVQLTDNEYVVVSLSVSSIVLGFYNLTVTGSNGNLHEGLPLTVSVIHPDFRINTSSSDLTEETGSTHTMTITLSSVGDFAGNVNLTIISKPNGPVISVPGTITLSPNATVPVSMIISTGSSSPGKYSINIVGTSGDVKHSTTILLDIISKGPMYYFVGGIIATLSASAVIMARLAWSRFRS